jgi:hypothetical protein
MLPGFPHAAVAAVILLAMDTFAFHFPIVPHEHSG